MAVKFGLLGDVEARTGGQLLDIGPARQRCVLVALLIDVNRLVPSDQLIERVWSDELPHRARNALAGYLSRLRHVLGDHGVQITRQPGGYVLTTDPSSIDLHTFRQLARRARAAAEAVEADALFDAAMSMWRGVPFASLDTPWMNDVRTALEAERFAVALDGNDAALRVGRHGELLPGLVTLSSEHPLDERLAGQLMLAQFRCGRQADALETFRAMRERLVEELGTDPGPGLRQVHQQILDGDPGHLVPTPAPRAAVTARPRPTVPRRITSFVGRERDISTVLDALARSPLVTLTGVGGVGKTRLGLEVASRLQAEFDHGAAFCELAPLEDGSAVGHVVAAALRLQQQQGLGIEDTVIDYLRTHRMLLLLDNCEHVLPAAARLADEIARHCPDVVVLATSREALGIEGERIVPVAALPVEDATALFAERAKAGRPDFDLDREPVGAVAEICRRLDGLPLAIELAAARMRAMSSLDVARRLDGLRLLRGGTRDAPRRQQSLAATIDWSYRLLTEREQALFVRLSVFAGGFDLDAAHGVCGADADTEDDILDLLTALLDKSMVKMRAGTTGARYFLLETLRAYGRDRLRNSGLLEDNVSRHARYYTGLAERAAAGMHGVDEGAWVERMTPDYDNLRVAFEHAVAAADIDNALRLVTSLSEFVHLRIGYESSGWAQRLVELTDPDHRLYAAAVGFAARGAWNKGEFEQARSLASLARGRDPGRGNGRVAYPGDVLADLALYEGDPGAALSHYHAEMVRARAENDPIRLVWTLFYVAICHAALRVPDDGIAAAEEAVAVSDTTANPTARSMARYALGLVSKKSAPERALALFDEAAELAASVQNFWWHGIASMEAAATRAVHDEPASAAHALIEVIDHWDRVGDWSQQWLNLRYVTRFLFRVGAEEDATRLHHALVAAGKESPLRADQLVGLDARQGAGMSGAQAVALALATLERHT
ncbi:BTAD domain-containing putative transcriptional regulator [Mycobacterium sp. ITM-2016-00318]|uniref:AfsR/SARP family transcriptional regulator n=1 Tax=Mycobacterium sp. ITM-2016-00318 TaxID=2099693 RepID=UPI000CFA2CA0|nr:BTAD domain-containing putative transcriptional regulator [Mycobacterium sp. ITM-2016-00318]WNG94819.1 BTAD domain-containing putative transcriptional regulator [Mycobacterium sp. ITM-2016-00318]